MKKGFYRGVFSGLLLFGGLLLIVTNRVEVVAFLRLLRQLDPFWLLLAVLFQAGTYLSLAMVWYRGFLHSGVRYPLRKLVPLALVKLFADQALPSGGISGIAIILNSFRQRQVSGTQGMQVMLLGIFSNYAAYLLVASASFLLFWSYHDLKSWMVFLSGIFLLVAVSIPVAVLLFNRFGGEGRLPALLDRLPFLSDLVRTYSGVPDDLLRKPLPLLEATLYQAAIFLLDAATLWAVLHSLGSPVSFSVAFPCFVVASIVAMLSLIPLGLGSFEVTCVALLVMLDVRLEAALTATLLLRGFTLRLPMIPGLVLARRELH